MQIKKFEAQSMTHALIKIKKEFGSDAVILSARIIKEKGNILSMIKKPKVEVTAATDKYYSKPSLSHSTVSINDYKDSSPGKSKHTNSITKNRSGIPFEKKHNVAGNKKRYDDFLCLRQKLLSQDIQDEIVTKIINEIAEVHSPNSISRNMHLRPLMVNILKNNGISAKRIKIKKGVQKLIAFVGPTGVGKTTTVAKLAAIAQTGRKSSRIALVTFDNERIAAIEQLKIYAQIIGVPFSSISTKKEINQVRKIHRDKDLILVDTAGISQNNDGRLKELKEFLSKLKPDETHLLLSASTKEKDLFSISELFRIIQANRLLYTKLDESNSYGNIFNLLFHTKIPISYFTKSQHVPEGIEIASLEKLVDKILPQVGKEEVFNRPKEVLSLEMEHANTYSPYRNAVNAIGKT